MSLNYDDRMVRVNDREPGAVRVKRAWQHGVHKGQVLDNLPGPKRRHLLRAGFVEVVKTPGVGKSEGAPIIKKKPGKKNAK